MTASPADAVARALALIGRSYYQLGTGDWNTPDDGPFDCVGLAICKAYGLRRHQPGLNCGPWASCSDDINANSAIEDAEHEQRLFVPAERPEPGVLLCYPTIRLRDNHLVMHEFIGHAAIVVAVHALEWDPSAPQWSQLDIVQCCGPNGRAPGVIRSSAKHFAEHDLIWPRPEHRTKTLRLK